jgi:cytosine deaminase
MREGAESVEVLARLAERRGLPLDLHCDESDDPQSRHIETLAAEAHRLKLGGRATASHATSMHSMDNYYVSKLIPLIAQSGINVIANPLINITLQGRHDNYPRRRGLTRIAELRAAGVNVALGQDCVMDPWYGLGGADMLDVAHMAVHAAPMTSREDIAWSFSAVTETAARAMGLEGYGLHVGAHADFVLLQAADPIEAVRLRAERLAVVRRGEIIARTPERRSSLFLDGRPAALDPAAYAPVGG